MMSPEEDSGWSPPAAAREPVWSSPPAAAPTASGGVSAMLQAQSPHGAEVLVMLTAMFPTVDADVISAVLESHYHQVGRSIDSLLAMTADATGESPPRASSDDNAAAAASPERATPPPSGAAAASVQAAPAEAAAAPSEAPDEPRPEPHTGAAVLVRPPGHIPQAPLHGSPHSPPAPPPAPLPAGGPVAMLAPRGGAAAAHAAAAAAAAAADIRRQSHASAGGRAPGASPASPQRFAHPGPESNLFAWVASLLSPNDGADGTSGGAFGGRASGSWGEPARGAGSGARDAVAYPGAAGSSGAKRNNVAGMMADDEGDGDSDLWMWQRTAGAADAAEEEAALAAGAKLWDATAGMDTAAGYLSVLASAPRSRCVLAMLEELAIKFNKSYDLFAGGPAVAVPRRLEAWRTELAAICAVLVAEFLDLGAAFRSARWHAPHRDALQLAVESVVLAAVHDKLMGGVQKLCERADDAMDEALTRLARLPPALLGVRREWADAAVEPEVLRRFRQLPHLVMPYEKVVCVRDTVRKLVENVQALRAPRRRRRRAADAGDAGDSDDGEEAAAAARRVPMPCADDVLSLLVLLLARGRVKHLVASAVYMDTFLCMTEATSHKGELGYALANFMAACEYVRSKDVARLCSEWEENGRAWEAQMRDDDGAADEEDAADAADAAAAAAQAGGGRGGGGGEGGEGGGGGGAAVALAPRRERDPLGVLSGTAAAAVAATARVPARRPAASPAPPGSPATSASAAAAAASPAAEPSLEEPWLLPPPAAPPPPGPQHAGVVLETSRGAAACDPLGALPAADVARDVAASERGAEDAERAHAHDAASDAALPLTPTQAAPAEEEEAEARLPAAQSPQQSGDEDHTALPTPSPPSPLPPAAAAAPDAGAMAELSLE